MAGTCWQHTGQAPKQPQPCPCFISWYGDSLTAGSAQSTGSVDFFRLRPGCPSFISFIILYPTSLFNGTVSAKIAEFTLLTAGTPVFGEGMGTPSQHPWLVPFAATCPIYTNIREEDQPVAGKGRSGDLYCYLASPLLFFLLPDRHLPTTVA